jgi:hypothetical protein
VLPDWHTPDATRRLVRRVVLLNRGGTPGTPDVPGIIGITPGRTGVVIGERGAVRFNCGRRSGISAIRFEGSRNSFRFLWSRRNLICIVGVCDNGKNGGAAKKFVSERSFPDCRDSRGSVLNNRLFDILNKLDERNRASLRNDDPVSFGRLAVLRRRLRFHPPVIKTFKVSISDRRRLCPIYFCVSDRSIRRLSERIEELTRNWWTPPSVAVRAVIDNASLIVECGESRS